MILEEILVANGAGIVLLVVVMISRYMTKRRRRVSDVLFAILAYIGITCCALEAFGFVIDGKEGLFLKILNYADNTILYGCTATVSVFWVWYVDYKMNHDVKRLRTTYLPMVIIWTILICSLIVNLFTGILFTIGEDNVYTRQPIGYVFYVFLMSSFVISIIQYLKFRKVHGKTTFFPIWMFLAPVLGGCLIQVFCYGLSVAWLGCAIGLTSIYVNLQSKMSHVDRLTGLYNRAYIEHSLVVARKKQKYCYSGIMLDIDRFKTINDTHGHSAGDRALIDAANIILKVCDWDSLAFRYAGDEFIIFIKGEAGKSDELLEKTFETEERLRRAAEEFNAEEDKEYQLEFSMGHALYNKNEPDDVFFHNIDSAMYADKQRRYKARQES